MASCGSLSVLDIKVINGRLFFVVFVGLSQLMLVSLLQNTDTHTHTYTQTDTHTP